MAKEKSTAMKAAILFDKIAAINTASDNKINDLIGATDQEVVDAYLALEELAKAVNDHAEEP